MSPGVIRRLALVSTASLAAVLAMIVLGSGPASADLPRCEPGYEFRTDHSCDGGDGWTYQSPVVDPPGPAACGVYVLRNVLSPTYHVDHYYYRGCGTPLTPVCITFVNPAAAMQSNSSGRQFYGTYLGGGLGADATYLDWPELVTDTIDPGSIFVRPLAPGQPCGPGLGLPSWGVGPGPGGTDPDAPDDPAATPDPCDAAHARCNTNGPDGSGGHGQAPHVSVFGQVVAPVNTGAANRPLSGARFELWYFGRDGGAGSAQQWRPVLESVDARHRPAGPPVVGYLNEDGSYRLDFVYPQTYQLADGSTWEGCPLDPAAPTFLRSKACAPDDLQLRIHPKNRAGTVVVTDVLTPAGVALQAHRVDLGRFHERGPGQQVSVAVSEHAMTYRAILNARTAWPGLSSHPRVTATIDDTAQPEGNTTGSTSFRLHRAASGTSVPEHEVGHLLARHVYGGDPPGTGCKPHFFTQECTNNGDSRVSAWWEGLATFLAQHAEHPGGNNTRHLITNGWFDLEDCVDDTGLGCGAGAGIEGNTAALLWDLVDPADDVNHTLGAADAYSTTVNDVLQVVMAHRPKTIDEFWAGWKAAHPAPDLAELRFRNRLGITGFEQANDARGQGGWADDSSCVTCALGDYIYSTVPGSTYRWDFNAEVTTDGRYDIWVRLPAGQPDATAVAAYRVPTANGIEEVLVDQHHAVDGWVNLKPAGFDLRQADDNHLLLSNSQWDHDGTLVADIFVLSAHPTP
jgi:hypothetical protein